MDLFLVKYMILYFQQRRKRKVGEISKDQENEVYKYNESGKIMIVMYHSFAEEEKDEWTRLYDIFYSDLLLIF